MKRIESVVATTGEAAVGSSVCAEGAAIHSVGRTESANEMWYPQTHLPPKRQLTVRAKSEERDRGRSKFTPRRSVLSIF